VQKNGYTGQEVGTIDFDINFDSSEEFELGMRMGNIFVTGDNAIAQFD
jgi:hypothetical protein